MERSIRAIKTFPDSSSAGQAHPTGRLLRLGPAATRVKPGRKQRRTVALPARALDTYWRRQRRWQTDWAITLKGSVLDRSDFELARFTSLRVVRVNGVLQQRGCRRRARDLHERRRREGERGGARLSGSVRGLQVSGSLKFLEGARSRRAVRGARKRRSVASSDAAAARAVCASKWASGRWKRPAGVPNGECTASNAT
eukprot:scaffold176222_cov29-Tisochrysis_lutea.AAC.3